MPFIKWFQFFMNDKPVGPKRKSWRQAAQDAVDNGYADWLGNILEWRVDVYSIKEVADDIFE